MNGYHQGSSDLAKLFGDLECWTATQSSNKAVHLISMYCSIDPADKCKRWSVAEKKRINVERPNVVKEYNQHMGGVDLCDMMLELYAQTSGAKNGTCALCIIV